MDAKEKLIEVYLTRIRNNEIEFDQIRKELEAKKVDNQIISLVVREVDQILRTEVSVSDTETRANKVLFFGVVTALFGAVLTIGSLFGWFSNSGTPVGVIACGPLLGVIAIIFAALQTKARLKNEAGDNQIILWTNSRWCSSPKII